MLIFFMNCFSPLQVTDLLQTEKIKRGKTRGMRDGVEKGYIPVCQFARTIFFLFPRRFTVRRIDKIGS